jgi:hypothetical protein
MLNEFHDEYSENYDSGVIIRHQLGFCSRSFAYYSRKYYDIKLHSLIPYILTLNAGLLNDNFQYQCDLVLEIQKILFSIFIATLIVISIKKRIIEVRR